MPVPEVEVCNDRFTDAPTQTVDVETIVLPGEGVPEHAWLMFPFKVNVPGHGLAGEGQVSNMMK
jgi:hypothetical protein